MFNFCIKADIGTAAGIEEQIGVCSRLMVNNMETGDIIDGVHLTEANGRSIERVRRLLITHNKKITILDSSIPTCEREQYAMLFRKANLLGVESIRITPGQVVENPQEDGRRLAEELKGLCAVAGSYGIGVILENQRNSCLAEECVISNVLVQLKEFQPGFIFNPLEFAVEKSHPFFHVFYNSRMKQYIKYLRVNDGLFADGSPAMPGIGNAEVKELASALLARSFKGYFCFHPYLEGMDENKYEQVINCFKKLLMAL